LIVLERIPEDRRREEEKLWDDFEAALPHILGGTFDILVKAISLRPDVALASRPRMADFAAWGYAIAEAAGWGGPAFLAAYERNINQQHQEAVAASMLAQVVLDFMEQREEWQGPASKLKSELDDVAENCGICVRDRRSGWPQDPARLSKALRRLAETLAVSGVHVTFPHQGSKRSIRLRKLAESTVNTVGTVSSSTGHADSRWASADGNSVAEDGSKSFDQSCTDGVDGTDGKNPPLSGLWEEDL
jgi:hypothetical protein